MGRIDRMSEANEVDEELLVLSAIYYIIATELALRSFLHNGSIHIWHTVSSGICIYLIFPSCGHDSHMSI